MDFGANKTPVEVIKEGAFWGNIFQRHLSWYYWKVVQKVMERIRSVEKYYQKYYCSDYYDVSVNKYDVKCGTSLRFWENKGQISEIDPYGWFQWYFRYWLGRKSEGNGRQINKWKKIVSMFRGKLVKMIKDVGSKYDDYSISPKIRQILLRWGYELTEKDFFINSKS